MQQIQSDVDQVKNCFGEMKSYSNLSPHIALVKKHDLYTVTVCLRAIKETLNDNSAEPIRKILAVRFAKELMDTHEEVVVDLFQHSLLDAYIEISLFQAGNPDVDRGKQFFSTDGDEQSRKLGNTFLRLVLECVMVWQLWYPLDQSQEPSQYKQAYDLLMKRGVTFPKLNYFKVEDLSQVFKTEGSAVFAQPNTDQWQDQFQQNLQKLGSSQSIEEMTTLIKFYEDFFKENADQFEYSMMYFCQRVIDMKNKLAKNLIDETQFIDNIHKIVQSQLDHQERQKFSFSQLLMLTPDRESDNSRPFDEKSIQCLKDSRDLTQKSGQLEQTSLIAQKDNEIQNLKEDTNILKEQVNSFKEQVSYLHAQIEEMERKIALKLESQKLQQNEKPNQKINPTSTIGLKIVDDDD